MMNLRLRGRSGCLLEKGLGFGECRLVTHRREQVAGLAERRVGFRAAEGAQAPALAEQGVGSLGNVPELLPAGGRFGVEACCLGVLAGVLAELGAGGAAG